MKVKFRKLHPEAQVPQYQTAGSAGLDLHARISHEIYLQPGVRFTCPTVIAIELPEGFEAQVRPRSGLSAKHGDHVFKIEPGMRIAQLVIAPVLRVELMQAGDLSDTGRGDGGFGSTGKC